MTKDQNNSNRSKDTMPERAVMWKMGLVGAIIMVAIALIQFLLAKK